ncbi:MAG: alpha/beta hydrolase [Gammaproteobacteria bacterium]|nr:alpha/beta hydrolase [Gammaproteobacteria bacterium]
MKFGYRGFNILRHRRNLHEVAKKWKFSINDDVVCLNFHVCMPGSDKPLLIRIFNNTSQTDQKLRPTFFYIPGTAFIAFERAFSDFQCAHIATVSHSQVIAINHRLAPEYTCPTAVQDVYRILRYLLEPQNRTQLKIDMHELAIGGYSSGGTVATLVAVAASKEGIRFKKQILMSPLTDLSRSLRSHRKEEAKDNVIPEVFTTRFLNLYFGKNAEQVSDTKELKRRKDSPWASPLYMKIPPYMPAADITNELFERFRSDGEAYAKKLATYGVLAFKQSIEHKERHGYWWHDLKSIEGVGKKLRFLFGKQSIPRPLTNIKSSNDYGGPLRQDKKFVKLRGLISPQF